MQQRRPGDPQNEPHPRPRRSDRATGPAGRVRPHGGKAPERLVGNLVGNRISNLFHVEGTREARDLPGVQPPGIPGLSWKSGRRSTASTGGCRCPPELSYPTCPAWCPVRDLNPHAPTGATAFEAVVSAIPPTGRVHWTRKSHPATPLACAHAHGGHPEGLFPLPAGSGSRQIGCRYSPREVLAFRATHRGYLLPGVSSQVSPARRAGRPH